MMYDYRELIAKCDEWICKADNFGADDLANHISACADAIEQLVTEREILAKMYAKVNEDLCVRTKERDAAVADIFVGCATCRHSYINNPNGKLCDSARECTDDYQEQWEWRGVQEDNT